VLPLFLIKQISGDALMEKVPSVKEIVDALFTLPPEQITTVYEFILFLKTRHGEAIDVSDSWTEEDLVDLRTASLQYASEALLADEADNG
jgi:hypothetical protein